MKLSTPLYVMGIVGYVGLSLQHEYDSLFKICGSRVCSTSACVFPPLLTFPYQAFEQAAKQHVVIAGGHSLWFRAYFRNFLPHSSKFIGKTAKIKVCALVFGCGDPSCKTNCCLIKSLICKSLIHRLSLHMTLLHTPLFICLW